MAVQERDLTEGERALWRAVETGELVDLRVGDEKVDDPANGAEWGRERIVRSQLLYELLIREEPTPRAVVLRGARIGGGLNLEAAKLLCPLILQDCFFDGPVNLREACAESIRVTACRLPCLAADQLETRGDLDLTRSTAAIITSAGAHIGGDFRLDAATLSGGRWLLDLGGATLIPPEDVASGDGRPSHFALYADGLRVDGDIFCRAGFTAQGEVRLTGARVGGQLVFNGRALPTRAGRACTPVG